MSSEDIQTETVVMETQGCGDQSDVQFSSDQRQIGHSSIGGASTLQTDPQFTAATSLLSLRTKSFPDISNGNTRNCLYGNQSRFDPCRLSGIERPYIQHWESTPYTISNPTGLQENTTVSQSTYPYSQFNMQNTAQFNRQNTIAGLTSAITGLQQEHLNMHTRQENITGTLEQVLSALHDIRHEYQTSSSHNAGNIQHASSTQPTANRNTDQTPGFCVVNNLTTSNFGQTVEPQTNATQITGSMNGQSGSFDVDTYTHNYSDPLARSHIGITNADRQSETHSWANDPSRNQDNQFSSFNGLFPQENSRDLIAKRYNFTNEGTGYSQFQDNRSRYSSQFHEGGQPQVTFYGTTRDDRRSSRDANFGHERRPFVDDAPLVPRSRYTYTPIARRKSSPENYGLKIPPFNGKEDWNIWFNRFEAIAERRKWDNEAKLDNLLPKLQGKAGEFVYSQLPKGILSHYEELVEEINSRFRVVETEKSFAAKFSSRIQRADETVEEFAADLKRLYAKAYRNRDFRTKREDLVRRFLDGMKDNEARFEIEFHKEPNDIDEAVYHAVNFIHTRRRNSHETNNEKRFKRYARRTSEEFDCISDSEEIDETEESHRALRVPTKTEKTQSKKTTSACQKEGQGSPTSTVQNDSMKVLTETRDLVQSLVSHLRNQFEGKKKQSHETAGFSGRKKVQCFGCKEFGHIVRDCPKTDRSRFDTEKSKRNVVHQQPAQQQQTHSLN